MTLSCSASWIAWNTSSSGHTQTGQPGPGTSSTHLGRAPRSPAWVIERSWPPHTFMILTVRSKSRAWIFSSQARASSMSDARTMVLLAVGLDRRAARPTLFHQRTLRGELLAQPAEPDIHAQVLACRQAHDRGGVGKVAQVRFGLVRIEVIEHGQQIGLGQQHGVGGAEHHRVLRWLVVAFGYREERDVEILAEVEARPADQVADVLDEQDVDAVEIHVVHRVVHQMGVEVAGSAGDDLVCLYALGTDAKGVVLGFEVALDHRAGEFVLQRGERGFEQRGLAGAGRRHQVDGEKAAAVEMLAVVRGLVVVLRQQPLQHGHRGRPPGDGLEREVLVAGGKVAAAGIAHDFYGARVGEVSRSTLSSSRSSPEMIWVRQSPQLPQIRRFIAASVTAPQVWQRTLIGARMNSSSASCMRRPAAASGKALASNSGTTPAKGPMRTRIRLAPCACCWSITASTCSTSAWATASSCTAFPQDLVEQLPGGAGIGLGDLLDRVADVHHDEVADRGQRVLHHEQADVAPHALGLAAGGKAFDRFDLHRYGETHGRQSETTLKSVYVIRWQRSEFEYYRIVINNQWLAWITWLLFEYRA